MCSSGYLKDMFVRFREYLRAGMCSLRRVQDGEECIGHAPSVNVTQSESSASFKAPAESQPQKNKTPYMNKSHILPLYTACNLIFYAGQHDSGQYLRVFDALCGLSDDVVYL